MRTILTTLALAAAGVMSAAAESPYGVEVVDCVTDATNPLFNKPAYVLGPPVQFVPLYYGNMGNVASDAYGGVVTADIDAGKILLRVIDKGPGIPDIDWAMQEGHSTASPEVRNMGFGAGMGLPNIKKNVDRLNVQSTVGVGTTVEMEVNLG